MGISEILQAMLNVILSNAIKDGSPETAPKSNFFNVVVLFLLGCLIALFIIFLKDVVMEKYPSIKEFIKSIETTDSPDAITPTPDESRHAPPVSTGTGSPISREDWIKILGNNPTVTPSLKESFRNNSTISPSKMPRSAAEWLKKRLKEQEKKEKKHDREVQE